MTTSSEMLMAEVRRVCSYVKDDGAVASYFAIPREIVENVRAAMPKPSPKERTLNSRSDGTSDIRGYMRIAEEEARCGSQRLNEALQSMFQRWEKKHGFQAGAGQLLLPAGWSEKSVGAKTETNLPETGHVAHNDQQAINSRAACNSLADCQAAAA